MICKPLSLQTAASIIQWAVADEDTVINHYPVEFLISLLIKKTLFIGQIA